MFRLEKVFQNNDNIFIFFCNIFKVITIFLIIYLYSILENNSIYEILKINIFINSIYFEFSFILVLFFFLFSNIFFKTHTSFFYYNYNILKKDLFNFILSLVISLLIIKFTNINELKFSYIYLFVFLLVNLLLTQIFLNKIYNYLVNQNIIQKNILLIGSYENIKKILNEKKISIYIYKCCIIIDKNNADIKKLRSEIKIPIFLSNEDIRSLLEYHSLGQIWIYDNKIKIDTMLNIVVKFSVDILIIKLLIVENNLNLINSKYHFINYEISRFHGSSLLTKIIMDKILSLFFLIILLPVLVLSMLLIYFEDGFPLFFTQDRTGWDGRRFKIYKLRSLKKINFKKTTQVIEGDDRLLKIGRFIRRFSIDEVPQFINVFIGDMSIVGPRPHMVEHDIYYSSLFKEFLKRHKANPGLTGWAQVNGLRGPTQDNELMKNRMDYDLWYLNNWSIYLDLKIILKTFIIIFKHKGV